MTSAATSTAASATDAEAAESAAIDASCRWPLLVFLAKGTGWLAVGSLLYFAALVKLHGPGWFVDVAWLNVGRLRPAAIDALLYGFAVQFAFALLLWLSARLGRAPLLNGPILVLAGAIYNLGLLLGILGILGGASTGYEFLELPKIAWPFLFVTLAVVGLWGLLSFHYRRRSDLYPSQWFLLGALFWLPWIVSVASFLLVFSNVRGVMQAVVNVWYAHNLLSLFLTPVGVAAIYYFIPKWAGRPLHSRSLAAAGFWMLAVAGGWGGMSRIAGGPIPYWMISVSVVANVFLAATAATVAVNVCQTLAAGGSKWSLGRAPVSMRFILLGTAAYAAASLLQALTGFATVAKVTLFTHLPVAVDHLLLFGFFGMVALGAAYDILPRLLGAALPSASLIRWHYLGSAIGLAVYVAALVAAGLIQGLRMNNPSVEFMSVVKSTIPFIGVATLGWIAFLLGQIAFLVNVQRAFLRLCAPACAAFCQACCPETASPAKSKGES